MSALKSLSDFDNRTLTITNWAGTGTDRIGSLTYLPAKEFVRLDILLNLDNPTGIEMILLSPAQLKHLKPDGGGFAISFTDYNDPA